MRTGRKSAAQTKAPLKDRIKGSNINKKGSASSTARASSILLSDEITSALSKKAKDFNEKYKGKKVSVTTLKAVFRRGAGAFSTSHRPNMTRNGWAYARVNKFLEKKAGKTVKAAYVQDDDLMEKGGELGQNIKCHNCGWQWNTRDSNESDKYVCHKCGFDNTLFYSNDIMSKGGKTNSPIKAIPITYTIKDYPEIEAAENWLSEWQLNDWRKRKISEEQIQINIQNAQNEINILTERTPFTTWFLEIPKAKYEFEVSGATYEIKYEIKEVEVEIGWKRLKQKKYFWYVIKTNEVKTPFDEFIIQPSRKYESKTELIYSINRIFLQLIREKDIEKYPLPNINMGNGGLIAPNGNKSNLTPEQYKLVRTPEFKAWFGDWENDPENASRVVDENGEPLVVYHGTNKVFNEFDIKKSEYGFFFTNSYDLALTYDKNINSFFLNIKKPRKKDFKGANYDGDYQLKDYSIRNIGYDTKTFASISRPNTGYDGAFMKNVMDIGQGGWNENLKPSSIYVVFDSKQIKLADGTNKNFDMNNPDVRYKDGGLTLNDNGLMNSIYPELKQLFYNNGLILREDYSFTDGSNKSYLPHTGMQKTEGKVDKIAITYYEDAYEVVGEFVVEIEEDGKIEIELEFPNWGIEDEIEIYEKGGEIELLKVGQILNLRRLPMYYRSGDLGKQREVSKKVVDVISKDSRIDEEEPNEFHKNKTFYYFKADDKKNYNATFWGEDLISVSNDNARYEALNNPKMEKGGTTKISKPQILMKGGKMKNIVEQIGELVAPFQKKLAEERITRLIQEGEKLSKWAKELIYLGLVYDLYSAIGNYLYNTDKLVGQIKFEEGSGGSIEISATVERDGQEYKFRTEMIIAGGYNIQRRHYRYIVHTGLKYHQGNAEAESVQKEIKDLKEKIKFENKIEEYEKDIEFYKNTIEKYKVEIANNKKFTDEQIWEMLKEQKDYRVESYNLTWEEMVRRKAPVVEMTKSKEGYEAYKYENYYLDGIKSWKESNIENLERRIRSYTAEIKKNEKRIQKAQGLEQGGELEDLHQKMKDELLQDYFKSHKSIEQIGEEKGVELDYAQEQLRKGMQTESEHSDDPMVQEIIALQHLDEMIDYYEKLEFIEANTMEKGGVIEFNKNFETRLNELKKDYQYDGSENDLSKINADVAISYMQYLAKSIGEQPYQWDWENESKHPTDYFQVEMQLESGNVLRALFVYVDNKHKVVKSKSNVKLYDNDYNEIKVLVEETKIRETIEESFNYKGIDFEILRANNKWIFFGKYLDNFQSIPKLQETSRNKLIDRIKRWADLILTQNDKTFEKGGQIEPDNKKTKDMITHKSGNAGGMLVGNRHSEGGIKAVNKSTNTPLEMEGGEVVITRNAVSDDEKREFEGKMLTNREILSKINESGGGVSFEEGGQVNYDCECDDKMAKGGDLKNFEPKSLVGKMLVGKIRYSEIVDVKDMGNGNIWVIHESFSGFTSEENFTKDELFEMSNGKEVRGEIIKSKKSSKMANGGSLDTHFELKEFFQEQNTPVIVEETVVEEIMIEVIETPAEIMLYKEDLTMSDDSPMIYVGSSIYANNSNGTDEWVVKSFSNDGVNLLHIPTSPLSYKHEDKHLSFDEIKTLFNDKSISIKFVLNERELNLILMILKDKLQNTTSFKSGGVVFVDKEGKNDEEIMESQFGNKQF